MMFATCNLVYIWLNQPINFTVAHTNTEEGYTVITYTIILKYVS